MTPTWQTADGSVQLYLADCLDVLPTLSGVDAVVADPPYGDTSLEWDSLADGWQSLVPTNCLWCFGSLRYFISCSGFDDWKLAQDIVWEKHNGSSFHADRFKRVHELAVQFYRGEWSLIYKDPQVTNDATKRTVRRKERPPHTGEIAGSSYVSEDGGPRMMRSILPVRSCHGYAEHPTQKPVEIIHPLVCYSSPIGGTILDPFMGSGTTGVACVRLGRKFIGIEKEPKYFDIAVKRIEAELNRTPLFDEPVPVQLNLLETRDA